MPVNSFAVAVAVFVSQLSPALDISSPDAAVAALSDPTQREAAVAALSAGGGRSLETIGGIITSSRFNPSVRGWAVIALSRSQGKLPTALLQSLRRDVADPLIKTWLSAAEIARASDVNDLNRIGNLQSPIYRRPLGMAISRLTGGAKVNDLLELAANNRHLQGALLNPVLAHGEKPLLKACLKGGNDNIRRVAAAYLGTLANRGGNHSAIGMAIARSLRYTSGSVPPWSGGALFIPSINWDKKNGSKLVRELYAWMLDCDKRGHRSCVRQIHNMLISIKLANAVGYRSARPDAHYWGRELSRAMGRGTINAIKQRLGYRH